MRSILKIPYYYWKGLLSDSLCNAIIEDGLKLDNKKAEVNFGEKAHVDSKLREGTLGWFPEGGYVDKLLSSYVQEANMRGNWNFIITGKEQPQFAGYKEGDFYDWHKDCSIETSLYRKLSATVQLSDPSYYKGGQFEIKTLWGQPLPMDKETTERGTVIIFPSILDHRVTPIVKGTRYSIVQWFNGPDFV